MKKYLILVLAFVPAFLVSCLKDKEIEDQEYGLNGIEDKRLIELSLTPLTSENYVQLAFDLFNYDTIVKFPVTFAYKNAAEEDIQVILKPNPALIGNYNALNGKMHEQAPAGVYTIQNPASSDGGYIVTIPKGSRKGYLEVTVNPTDFLGFDYALAFEIARIENPGYIISSNFSTGIVAIGIKNKYDGIYALRSKQLDWLAAYNILNTVWDWPTSYGISMITSGGNSINMFSNAHSSYIHPTVSTSGYSGFGSTNPKFIFDLTTNNLTDVVNDFAGSTRTFQLNPAVTDSRYDPGTGTIYAAIIMKQPGRPDLQIFDTLTYIGPR